MNNGELRQKTLGGLIWKFAERMGAQIVSFIVQLVLARLLMPNEFAVIAIVQVFISLFNVFITNGLGTALIQKKDADEVDFSTVLIFNVLFSAAIYFALFILAPAIAGFYDQELLTPVLRVLGIQILLSGFKTVQQAYVAKKMMFRCFFWATLVGTILSGVVGIVMAYRGAGVWALVAQHLTNSTVDVLMLLIVVGWKPRLVFSVQRLTPLVQFGWKILAGSLVNTLYNNLRTLVIGKKYTNDDLAYYNRGQQIPDLIYDNTAVSIESVLFPAMSTVQDDIESLRAMTRRFVKECAYILTPILIGVVAVAEPLVKVLLTDKWLPAVPYIQIYCVVRMLGPLQIASMQTVKALGRSEILLRLEFIKKGIGLLILLISMNFGVIWIAGSNLLYSVIVLIMNAFVNKSLIKYTYLQQIMDFLPTVGVSAVMLVAVYCTGFINMPMTLLLIVQIAVGVVIYVLTSVVFKMDAFVYLLDMIRSRMHLRR